MKVVLRNPRRELEVPAPRTVAQLLTRPRRGARVGARDPQRHARDPRRAPRTTTTSSRSARSCPEARAVKCRRCREPAVIDVRRHNAGFCARLLHAPLPGAGAAGDRGPRHDRPGRPGARRGVGRQGLARAVAAAARARLRGRRPLRRARHRRVLRRVGRLRARVRRAARLAAARGRPARRRTASTFPSGVEGDPPRAVLGVRAVEAPRVQRRRARRTATTCSRPATTSTTKPRCCSATCCAGTTGYLGRQHPVLPAAPGLRAQGEAARAARRARARGVLRADRHRLHRRGVPDGGGQPSPRLQGAAQRDRGALAGHEGRVPVRLPRARPRALRGRRGRGARRPAPVPGVRFAHARPRCARSAGCARGRRRRSRCGSET